jgi:hypothetical protein
MGDKHDDELQDRRGRKDQERPFDRPNAAVGRGDGRVDDAMRMTVGMIMAMEVVVVLAMAVPVRAETQPIQNLRDHARLATDIC